MGFRLQAVPSVPVPDVAAVITVDDQALGGGRGLAHRVHLPEGSMMTEFVAAMEGLSLAPATTVNASVEQAEPPPPPPTLPPAAKSRPPVRTPPVQPSWAADRPTDTASERFLSFQGPGEGPKAE